MKRSELRIVADLEKIKLHPDLISNKDVGDPSYRAAVNKSFFDLQHVTRTWRPTLT